MAFSDGEDYKDVIEALPRKWDLRLYGGFWFHETRTLPSIMYFLENFKPRPTDIYLMTYPKCGTTWIKALAFSILNRHSVSFENHPLLTTHPQKLVSSYLHEVPPFSKREWEDLPSPRLLAGHLHYSLLPDQMKDDSFGCRMIYVARDPKDAFISYYFFVKEIMQGISIPFNELFAPFCDGYTSFGSIWDHQMEYKRGSLERPDKVLFLNYEEMKESPEDHVRRIAKFLRQPFSEEEEREGVVGEIVKLCSFDFLKELEVNKQGTILSRNMDAAFKDSSYFRKGKVGDWKEHLTPEMAERMDVITRQKKDDYGLI